MPVATDIQPQDPSIHFFSVVVDGIVSVGARVDDLDIERKPHSREIAATSKRGTKKRPVRNRARFLRLCSPFAAARYS